MALLLPRLRKDQLAIVTHPAKIKVCTMGRRYGKTLAWGAVALACANAGGAVGWAVPEYKNVRAAWRFFLQTVAPLGRMVGVNKNDYLITFPSGGWLAVYSMDNAGSIRSEALDLFLGDEAAKYRADDFQEVVLPTLADRDGKAVLFGSPMGLNWYYAEAMAADVKYRVTAQGLAPYGDPNLDIAALEAELFQHPGASELETAPYSAFFTAPSNVNPMPTIQRAFLLAKQRLPSRIFRQEWLAEFVEEGGEVFRKLEEMYIPVEDSPGSSGLKYPDVYPRFPMAPYPGTFVQAIDWGRENDWTVMGVMDVHTRRLVDYERFRKVDWKLQQDRAIAMGKRWGVVSGLGERNSMGEPNIEAIQRGGIPITGFTTTNLTKATIIEDLVMDIENKAIGVPKIAELDAELRAYTQERLPSGMIRYTGPQGVHDDTVIMLALLNSASKDYGSGVLYTF